MRSTPLGLSRALLALLLIAVLTGCDLIYPPIDTGIDFEGAQTEQLAAGQQLTVPLEIQENADGGTLAFVPVFFKGQGPYSFALDTGASHSVIDESIVEEAGLALTGETRPLTGIAGIAEAKHAQVDTWRMGEVDLPPLEVASMRLAAGEEPTMRGLLGSDVLSRFDRITIDYVRAELILQPAG